MDWSKINTMEGDDGMTFWKKKDDNTWSRNIVDLINYLKELEELRKKNA